MITIYNESKYPWILESKKDKTIAHITKLRNIKVKGKDITRAVSIMAYTSVLNNLEECGETLEQAVGMTNAFTVCDSTTSIIFNKKELNPVINAKGFEKTVLLSTINLRKRRIINIVNENSFLLKAMTVADEFSFVSSFNKENSSLALYLLNEKTNTIDVIVFTLKEGNIVKTESTVSPEEVKFTVNGKYQLKVFRPRRVTDLVLAHPVAMDSVKDSLGEKHTYKQLTLKDFEQVVQESKAAKYRAVTYAINKTSKEETPTDKKRSKQILDRLTAHFNVVYKAYSDGNIEKIKQ